MPHTALKTHSLMQQNIHMTKILDLVHALFYLKLQVTNQNHRDESSQSLNVICDKMSLISIHCHIYRCLLAGYIVLMYVKNPNLKMNTYF